MKQKRKLFSSLWDLPYGKTTSYNLFDNAKNSKEFVQKLTLQQKIPVHVGCVNSIVWNDTGKYLLSGSDDQHLSLVDGCNYSVLDYIPTGHKANIFSAKFLPNTNDKYVISCSGDGTIIYSNLDRPETSLYNKFSCHKGTVYEIMTVPNDPNTFLSCGEDRTVRWFDLRSKELCAKEPCTDDILIHCQSPVTSLAVNPYTPYQLAVGCADASVRIFDRRMLCTQNALGYCASNGFDAMMTCFTVPEFTQSRRITSLCYSGDGQEMLVSYSSDYIYLFDIRDDMKKSPRLLSADNSPTHDTDSEQDSGLYFRGRPLMKRLRIRGDWSDTGPNARPESEARPVEPEPATSRSTIVRTMTDILTRMFNTDTHVEMSMNNPLAPTPIRAGERSENSAEGETSNNTIQPQSLPSTSQSLSTNDTQSSSLFDQSQPSTSRAPSSTSAFHVPEKKSKKGIPPKKNINAEIEEKEANKTSGAENIEKEMESRRKDLVDRHHTEPMVNLHYSGQGPSSGQVTMDVATSSSINERQWYEQSDDLMPYHEEDSPSRQDQPQDPVPFTSSESDTDTDVQSVRPSPAVRSFIGPRSGGSSDFPPANADMELLMEVDSWEDSDDEPRAEERGARSMDDENADNCTFMDSLDDEVKAANDELKKVGAHMSSVTQPRVKRKYTGHRNARTMIKEATFWGDNFIMSGSDCGHIFIWDRYTTELVMLMEADHHVVNCLQPHPFDPVLASSGIDYDIKLWSPTREEPFFDVEKANEIIKRNEIMLEETKDTITVPATFMFRMFTQLSHFRTGRAYRWSRAAREMRASANPDASER